MTVPAPRHNPATGTRGWRVFLRPGWIALAAVVIAFAILCFRVFAPWQLGKHSRTQARDSRIEHALAAPPIGLGELLASGVGPAQEWRGVVVTGTYASDKQLLLRPRPVNGNAQGPQILVLLRFDGGKTILVDRGYLPQGETTAPPVPSGEVTVKARVRLLEHTPPNRPGIIVADHARQLEAIDAAVASPLVGAELEPAYLQLGPGQPGMLGALEEPNLDPGPYLSYGLQWLAFGVIALLALGYFGYTELRPPSVEDDAGPGREGRGSTEPDGHGRAGRAAEPAERLSRAERKRALRAALAGEAPPARGPGANSRLADRYGR